MPCGVKAFFIGYSTSTEEIEAAFRAMAKKLHSDAGGSDAAMAELNAARAKLKESAA